ncbi:MAG: hypothetical protein ACKOOI_16455 [Pirellula sp.]
MAKVSWPRADGLLSIACASEPVQLEQPAWSSEQKTTNPSQPKSSTNRQRADGEVKLRDAWLLFGRSAMEWIIQRSYGRSARQVRTARKQVESVYA